jgi:hypothetical protein
VKKCKAIVGLSLFRIYDFEAACQLRASGEIEQRVQDWLKTDEGRAWVQTLCRVTRQPLELCELSDEWLEVTVGSYDSPAQ